MDIWEKAKLIRDLNKANQEVVNMQKSRQYYQRRCEILETIISDHNPSLLPPRGLSQQEEFFRDVYHRLEPESTTSGPDAFESFVIEEIQRNSRLSPHARRWSPTVAMFCFVWMSLGPKSYRFARSILTLPCEDTLFRTFREPQEAWKDSICDVGQISRICTLFRRRHGIIADAVLDVGIGIDAMSMEPVNTTVDGESCIHNHVFAFILLPLSPQYKPVTLHLLTAQSGNANETVHSVLGVLKESLSRLSFRVRFTATDGDSGYSKFHNEMFSCWYQVFKAKGLECALDLLEQKEVIVSDLLHLLKNARARIINGSVTMNLDGHFSFNALDMNAVLNLGNVLTDRTTTGKMRDDYPFKLFTIENVLTLLMNGKLNMAFFLLPYSLLNIAVRSPNLSVQMRMDVMSIVMDIFCFHEECLNNLDKNIVSETKRQDIPQYFCSLHHCHRVLNTLAVTLREMKRSPTNIALDRVGTHVLECQFGIIRMLCHYKHSWKRILRSFANSMIVTDIASILGHELKARARVNHGGVAITEDSLGSVYIATSDVNIREIYELVNVVMAQNSGSRDFGYDFLQEMIPNLADFVSLLSVFLMKIDESGSSMPKIWTGSQVSHQTIMSRLISFCKQPQSIEQAEERQDESSTNEFVTSCEFDVMFLDQETPK